MNYKIFRDVLGKDLLVSLQKYGLEQTVPVIKSGYETDEMLGKFAGDTLGAWRKHNTAFLPKMLKIELNKQLINKINLNGIYPHVYPDIGTDTMINIYGPGDFVLEHIDPPLSIWDSRNLKRRANFSCMLDNNFTGGELVVDGQIVEEELEPGDVVVFAQPQPHQVSPVLSGRRIVAFGWIYDTGLDNAE